MYLPFFADEIANPVAQIVPLHDAAFTWSTKKGSFPASIGSFARNIAKQISHLTIPSSSPGKKVIPDPLRSKILFAHFKTLIASDASLGV